MVNFNKKNVSLIIVVISIIIVLVFIFLAIFPNFEVKNIYRVKRKVGPIGFYDIWDKYIVWSERGGGIESGVFQDVTIYYTNIETKETLEFPYRVQLFYGGLAIYNDTIYVSGAIQGKPNGTYAFNIANNELTWICPEHYSIDVDKNMIVWIGGWDSSVGGYNISSKKSFLLNQTNTGGDFAITVYNDYVVWSRTSGEIFLYDISKNTLRNIAISSFGNNNCVSIYGNNVVYEDNEDVYLYSINYNTTVKIFSSKSHMNLDDLLGVTCNDINIFNNTVIFEDRFSYMDRTDNSYSHEYAYAIRLDTKQEISIPNAGPLYNNTFVSTTSENDEGEGSMLEVYKLPWS